jgi:threonine/homoserine/homoserine lactone efflux protein
VSSLFGAFGIGLVAGFAIAMPLGAIAVLLLREGMLYGFKVAAAGAAGVASVDFVYATIAVVAGTAVSHVLSGHERIVHLVGAAVLVFVAVRGILNTRKGTAAIEDVQASPLKTYVRFFGLTAINPATALYFAVVAAGFGSSFRTSGTGAMFVLGVFIASLAWQLLLATIGSVSGARLSQRWRDVTSYVGYGIVLILAVALALTA